jgi:hypothetical protein
METTAAPAVKGGALWLRLSLLAAILLVAFFNGTKLSPFYDPVAYLLHLNLRSYRLMSARMLYEAATWPIALMTLMLAGIPAALYERIRGLQSSSIVSLSIWLVVTIALTLPTILRLFGEE